NLSAGALARLRAEEKSSARKDAARRSDEDQRLRRENEAVAGSFTGADREGESVDKLEKHEQDRDLSEELAESSAGRGKEQVQAGRVVLHRPTTMVSPRDTLVSIAEAFFHDPNLAWLIADLN